LTGTPGRSCRVGAAVGQDNDYVFGELLALADEEIRTYLEAGAIEAAGPRWTLTVLPPQLSALAACRLEGRL
jgi:hypothetical protein